MPWIESLLLPLGGVLLLTVLPLMTRQRLAGRLVLAGGWCVLWLTLTGLAVHADRDLPPKLPYEPAMRLQAEEQYKELCSECHGDEGRGDGAQAATFDHEVRDLTAIETWEEIPPECTFCHELGEYHLDEKEHKQVARKMVTLVDHMRQNFDSYFVEGTKDNQIGCWTCHRGEAEIDGYFPEEEDEDWL